MNDSLKQALMLVGVLALPLLLMIKDIKYVAFKRYLRSPPLLITGAFGAAIAFFGGRWGTLGLCFLVPCLQAILLGAVAHLYEAISGRELKEVPFAAFLFQAKPVRQILDMFVCVFMVSGSFGLFLLHEQFFP